MIESAVELGIPREQATAMVNKLLKVQQNWHRKANSTSASCVKW